MNEQLKFSWGHIVAFIALIAVAYFSFMGFTYLTDGNFIYAIIGASLCVLCFIFVFFGAQLMKSSGKKIHRNIKWERALIFLSPLVLVGAMIPISHFWTVKNNDADISRSFVEAINNSRQLFSDYEIYSALRLKNYGQELDSMISVMTTSPELYKKGGFSDGNEQIQKENMMETLQLMLLSSNYDDLKFRATEWLDNASEGTSTWNIFLLGNKREIKEAVQSWENSLQEIASHHLTNEGYIIPVPEFKSNGASLTVDGIDGLTASFTSIHAPTLAAIFFGIVIYLMVMLPYFIQQRHGRQVAMKLSLFGFKNKSNDHHDIINTDNTNNEMDKEEDAVEKPTSFGNQNIKKEEEVSSEKKSGNKPDKPKFKSITLD